MQVYLSEHIAPSAYARLARHFEIVDNFDHPEQLAAMIIRRAVVPRSVIARAPNLKVIAMHGVSRDTIDTAAAAEYGVPVPNVPGLGAPAVAELAVAQLLALNRQLKFVNNGLCAGRFDHFGAEEFVCHEMTGRTLGLVGTGNIAHRVADILRAAFDVRVLCWNPRRTAAECAAWGYEQVNTLPELFRRSDFVNVSITLCDATRDLINAPVLAAANPDLLLVNTSRGGIVNEHDLYVALTTGQIRAAASDVNAALLPFAEKATSFIDQLMQIVDSEEFRQIGASYDGLPPELRQRVDAVLDLLPSSVREAARQILAASANADQILAQLQSLRGQLSQLTGLADGMVQIVVGEAQVAAGRAQLDEAAAAYARLDAARSQIAAGRAELDAGQVQLDAQRKNAQEQLDAARSQLDSGAQELVDGQAQLEAARAEFAQQRADALAAIADARDQISSIDDAAWYVQDRESLASYSSVESDATSIEAIGTALPVVFFVVAVLISLTTMTRMVEEERGLIGLYKALGYGRGRILSKYVVYAAAACLAGGVAGNILGFVVLPLILFTIFSTMYALPAFYLSFDVAYALVSVGLFAVGIVGATALTCRRELAEQPAALMRPKAPKAGSRILLERVAPLWRRLSFLNKVTARNIFRYKRRFLMTVFGIAGCTALLVCGFGIRDSVVALSGKQYGQVGVTRYDLMLVTSAADLEDVAAELDADAQVTSFVPARVDSLTVEYGGSKDSVTLVVVPDDANLADYVVLADDSGAAVDLADSGVAITKNAEQVLHFSPGDTLHVQDATLHEADVEVGAVVMNYLGNTLYMTQSAYERAFGQKSGLNGLLVKLGGTDEQKIAFSEKVSADARTLSAVSTAKLTRDFSSAFTLINTVVYVVIVLAAALSFTVVFTLSNTNISERERELATIKVLGFRPHEVHTYINKETLLLTGLGVVFGLPGGYLLTRGLTWILRMPSLYFDTTVAWSSYAISAALAFVFTIAVSLLTNRSLDRVDMVGALKSAE